MGDSSKLRVNNSSLFIMFPQKTPASAGGEMNADINGAVNTGRKYNESIFPEGMDCGYLYGTVKAMTYKDILSAGQENHKSNPGETGQRASVCPVSA